MKCILPYFRRSSEEAHIGSTHAIVGVPDTAEHPLGPGLTAAVSTEEVEENGRVQRFNSLFSEVVVVGVNLGATIVVSTLSSCFHQARVSHGEFAKALVIALKFPEVARGDESVELLLLVANLVLFHDNASSEMLEEILSKVIDSILIGVVIGVESGSLFVRGLAGINITHELLVLSISEVINLLEVDVVSSGLFLISSGKTVLSSQIIQLVELLLNDANIDI